MLSFIKDLSGPQAVVLGAIIAALATFISNVCAGILRDFIAKTWTDRQGKRLAAEEIFQKYAEPLASVTTSLFWRLKEILAGDARGLFLVAKEPRTDFETYKLLSTYYRLAALLGCIRALKREFSYYRTFGLGRLQRLDEALSRIEGSLADGHHVELQRLRGVLSIYGIQEPINAQAELRLATELEQRVKSFLARLPMKDLTRLSYAQQNDLCTKVAALISHYFKLEIGSALSQPIQSAIIKQIAIREAWIFRDWQTAIGDMMIRTAEFSQKSFEVIGFGEFEKIVCEPSRDQYRNLARLAALFDEVDLETESSLDARGAMLKSLYRATACLICALADDELAAPFLNKSTLEAARVSLTR